MMNKELEMYGMSVEDIKDQYMNSITARFTGLEMVVMGILSDSQEMLAMGSGPRAIEWNRKQMNIAKFILSEMLKEKREMEEALLNDPKVQEGWDSYRG